MCAVYSMWNASFFFIRVMKTIITLSVIFGAAQFALANSVVTESLLGRVKMEASDWLVFGSVQGSYGLIGALCFAAAVILRLKRPGR